MSSGGEEMVGEEMRHRQAILTWDAHLSCVGCYSEGLVRPLREFLIGPHVMLPPSLHVALIFLALFEPEVRVSIDEAEHNIPRKSR